MGVVGAFALRPCQHSVSQLLRHRLPLNAEDCDEAEGRLHEAEDGIDGLFDEAGYLAGLCLDVSQGLTTGFSLPGERPTQPSRPQAPPRPLGEPQMPGRGLNQKTVATYHMWRFCDITGRNRPVLSLHHRPSLPPSERPRSPNKGTRAC